MCRSKILRAGFGLTDHSLNDRPAARRHELNANSVAPRKGKLHAFAQFRARRIDATTLPSFFAASTILSQSLGLD